MTEIDTAADRQDQARHWLLLIYRIKAESSGRRTYVWRQLRQLGAVYLQQAAAVLPDRPPLRAELDRLGQRIRTAGWEASLLETTSPSAAWEDELVSRFNTARDAEYEEILDSVRFDAQIAYRPRFADQWSSRHTAVVLFVLAAAFAAAAIVARRRRR